MLRPATPGSQPSRRKRSSPPEPVTQDSNSARLFFAVRAVPRGPSTHMPAPVFSLPLGEIADIPPRAISSWFAVMHNGPGPLQRLSCATVCVAREVKESSSLTQQNAADVEGFSKCFADRPHHRASSQRYKGGRERNEAVNADSRRAKKEARRWMRKRTAIRLAKGSWTPSNTLNRTKSRYIRATVKPIEYMATQPSAMIFWNFSQKTDTASSFCFPSTKSFVLYFDRPVRLKAPSLLTERRLPAYRLRGRNWRISADITRTSLK